MTILYGKYHMTIYGRTLTKGQSTFIQSQSGS